MNTLINNIYWTVWAKLSAIDPREEDGAEAVEWIAMVAILMIVLFALNTAFGGAAPDWAKNITASVTKWVTQFTTGSGQGG